MVAIGNVRLETLADGLRLVGEVAGQEPPAGPVRSTTRTPVDHDGLDACRTRKVAGIASRPDRMEDLQVGRHSHLQDTMQLARDERASAIERASRARLRKFVVRRNAAGMANPPFSGRLLDPSDFR